MILDNTEAGPGLKLWAPMAAVDRMHWEGNAHIILTNAGFQRVYTPYIFKKELQEIFKGWVEKKNELVKQGEDEEKYKDCSQYTYLSDKRLCHLQIFRNEPHSYSELPQRYFEIAEVYKVENGKVVNDVAVLLTEICELNAISVETISMCRQIDFLDSGNLRIQRPVDLIAGKTDLIQFVASTNTKENACLILAKAVFQWQKVEKLP